MTDAPELYRKYRPEKFSDIVGQDDAIAALKDMGRRNAVPHCLLFTGPSGTGKTTAARILRRKLGCGDADFVEVNAAKERGIEMVRAVDQRKGLAPISGRCRVWLIDECHALTSDAQSALLKMLEDTPGHAYFMLATTHPQKLHSTIITRSTEIKFKGLGLECLRALVDRTAAAEGGTLDEDVRDKLVEAADGSARKALVLLHAVIGIADPDEQRAAISAGDFRAASIDLARALFKYNATWGDVAPMLAALEEDPEQVRHHVMGYARAILLKGGKGAARAAAVISEFRYNFFDSKAAGLALACWDLLRAE